jgi:hypothetical protein
MAKRRKKFEFLMNTDWMFERPIDREHKEYKLLSYFQKMGEKLDNLELYPGFIELSLHLMNVQGLIKDKKIVYTDKKFIGIDDELLVKDLKAKQLPDMTDDEMKEFIEILTFSAPRIFEYFNIAKSVWTIVFDSVDMKIKKNQKNVLFPKGFFYYVDDKTKKYYVWQYIIKKETKQNPEKMSNITLIYNDLINDLTLTKIISNFSTFDVSDIKVSPVFHMTSSGEFPIDETLYPIFKRRIAGYISQTKISEQYKENKENLKIEKD